MIHNKLRAVDYQGVTLKNSPFSRQRDETLETYLLHPSNDDILHSMRCKAGLPSHVNGMPGWGPSVGQYLGAYAKLYCNTKDERVRDKCLALFHGWCACAERCEELMTPGTYLWEKLLGGMLDMYEFMDVQETRPWVERITRRAMVVFSLDIPRNGMQDERMKGQIEWYTLPENLYRAYQLFGDEFYRDYAGQWLYPYLWDRIERGDFEIGPRHAYSHVNCLSSAARAYIVTEDPRYLDMLHNAYEELERHHTYATGGYGPAETLFGEEKGYLGDALLSTWDKHFAETGPDYRNFGGGRVARSDAWGSCEVSCCSWAVFKLCHYLLQLTGDARYGDWAERLLINGTLGQPPITAKGQVLYYASYFADGAIKSYDDRRLQTMGQNFVWQCCTGTFPQDVAEYCNMIAYFDADGPYISQLIPAKVEFSQAGQAVTLISYGDFPREHGAQFTIHTDAPVHFILRVRVPAWANGDNSVLVNGKKQTVNIRPDTWMTLDRTWADGDEVTLSLPYELRFAAVDTQHPRLMALCYGPLVLTCNEMTVLVGDTAHPADWIKPVIGEDNVFETLPGHSGIYNFVCRRFTPYYRVGLMEWYYMYNYTYPDMETLAHEHQGF